MKRPCNPEFFMEHSNRAAYTFSVAGVQLSWTWVTLGTFWVTLEYNIGVCHAELVLESEPAVHQAWKRSRKHIDR